MKKGKAIYEPAGKAGEYAKYACNFYVGCSNDCDYCYCKRGVLGHAMGKPQATLKKCFADEEQALRIFQKELRENINELQQHGLFFTFTSDPMLKECRSLTIKAIDYAVTFNVPCKILTKRADFLDDLPSEWFVNNWTKERIAFGFTLTGCDELEKGANTNDERIETMHTLHIFGFKTFASIEPVIDIEKSYRMIRETLGCCDLYKIGLISGKRNYNRDEVANFVRSVNGDMLELNTVKTTMVYWKDSVIDYLNTNRNDIRFTYNHCVNADYNIFK